MASKQARVLSGFTLDAQTYKANQVIEADAALVKQFVKDGVLDDSKEAVAHALNNEGAQVIVHTAAEAAPEEPAPATDNTAPTEPAAQ